MSALDARRLYPSSTRVMKLSHIVPQHLLFVISNLTYLKHFWLIANNYVIFDYFRFKTPPACFPDASSDPCELLTWVLCSFPRPCRATPPYSSARNYFWALFARLQKVASPAWVRVYTSVCARANPSARACVCIHVCVQKTARSMPGSPLNFGWRHRFAVCASLLSWRIRKRVHVNFGDGW